MAGPGLLKAIYDFVSLLPGLDEITFKNASKTVALIFFTPLSLRDAGKSSCFHLGKLTIF